MVHYKIKRGNKPALTSVNVHFKFALCQRSEIQKVNLKIVIHIKRTNTLSIGAIAAIIVVKPIAVFPR